MHIEFLVEEPSAEAALRNIVPGIAGPGHSFVVHPHQGKPNLLRSLPGRLRGYASWLPRDWRIVVLVDRDRQECHELKGELEQMARDAGLLTRTATPLPSRFQVINRIAIEELEAWFFGDADAIRAAYPGVPRTFERRSAYRQPDAIGGGTWEALERLLQRAGYFRGGLAKIEAATAISGHMDPGRNRSRSFCVFRDALAALVET